MSTGIARRPDYERTLGVYLAKFPGAFTPPPSRLEDALLIPTDWAKRRPLVLPPEVDVGLRKRVAAEDDQLARFKACVCRVRAAWGIRTGDDFGGPSLRRAAR